MTEVKTVAYILVGSEEDVLNRGSYPFTHVVSGYTTRATKVAAGHTPEVVSAVKLNAAALLDKALSSMSAEDRSKLRVFVGYDFDPYTELEAEYHITRQLLKVFAKYDDLDLLVIQTTKALAAIDFALMKTIPYLWLSYKIETDDKKVVKPLDFDYRLGAVTTATETYGLNTQIVVSPCLPYTRRFANSLRSAKWSRLVITPEGYIIKPHVHDLYIALRCTIQGRSVEWANECGILPRGTSLPLLIQLAFGWDIEAA